LSIKRPPSLTNPRLAIAMSHPTRLRAMRVVSERLATPREIAAEIDEPINNVAYHIKVLKKLECIELVQVKQARGGRVAEHFYKATQRPYWDAAAWEKLDEGDKLDVTSAIMQQISEDIAIAMSNGTFNDPDTNHISRLPMVVDKDGWGEVVSLLEETLESLMTIQERVDGRRDEAVEALHTKIEIIQFRSPAPKAPEID
jgi:DNA-binding transcriptional ArsR family regulator